MAKTTPEAQEEVKRVLLAEINRSGPCTGLRPFIGSDKKLKFKHSSFVTLAIK